MPRTKIPSNVIRDVLTEAGYRCAVPTCRNILAIDLHHIVEVKDGGPNEASNLLALCPTCHALYTRGTISKEAIYAWKTMLVSLNHAFDQESISSLLFLYKVREKWRLSKLLHQKIVNRNQTKNEKVMYFSEEEIRDGKILVVSGDGLLKFSHLIASGLADYDVARVSHEIISYIPFLTEKGSQVLKAWFSGNRNEVKKVLGGLLTENVEDESVLD